MVPPRIALGAQRVRALLSGANRLKQRYSEQRARDGSATAVAVRVPRVVALVRWVEQVVAGQFKSTNGTHRYRYPPQQRLLHPPL